MTRGQGIRPGLWRGRLSETPDGAPLCATCRHNRASHGREGARCWARSCTCSTGYLIPERTTT